MRTSHRADGPGGLASPGPGPLAAFFANDNSPRVAEARITGVRGLVLAFETGKDGAPRLAIRAMDEAGQLAPPLHAAEEADDIIALWRGLGRDLDLQLFILDIRGVMTPLAAMRNEQAFARRKGSALSGRRPRFLARRKPPFPRAAAGKCVPRSSVNVDRP